MKRIAMLSALVLVVLCAGCDKKEDKKDDKKATVDDKPAAPSASAPPVVSDDDLAVDEEFSDEAESTINVANYKKELESAEKDIDSDEAK